MKGKYATFLRKSVSAAAIVIMAAGLSGCLKSMVRDLVGDVRDDVEDHERGTRTTLNGFGIKVAGKKSTDSKGNSTQFSHDTSVHGPADLSATVTTDANDDVTQITVNYDNGDKTGTYNSSDMDPTETRPGSHVYRKNGTRLKYKTYDGYDYLSYGSWKNEVPKNATNHDFWIVRGVVGEQTRNMPTKGQARYSGIGGFDGVVLDSKNRKTDNLVVDADAHFTADFNTGAVTGGLNNFKREGDRNVSYGGHVDLSNARITGNTFEGSLTGDIKGHQLDASRSKVKGGFFGPNAEEMGGVMIVKVPHGGGSGAFIARKR